MATTLSQFPQSSSPSNSWLPLPDAYVNMAETTMAPADLAPAERSMPVGYRFHPTDQELVGHYLRHKLKADDLSIHETIPEIGVCKGEPWDLLDWAASASAAKFDESECFFFSPRDYKYSNSTRSNRATLGGFWKVTGRGSKITSKKTNKVIGTKKTLVYYEGRVPRAIKTNWIIHEYHDNQLCHDQRSHVLCWLRKDNKKKIKENNHQLVDDYGSEANICMNSDEHYYLSSMIQGCSESNEAIDSMIQIPFGSNEVVASQSNRAIDSMIQIPFESNEVVDSMILVSSPSNGAIDSMIKIPFESNEVVDSPSNGAIDSMIQIPFESNEVEVVDSMILVSSPSNGAIDSMIQIPFESNEVVDSMIPVSSQSNGAINSMVQIPFESIEVVGSMIQVASQSDEAVDSMIQKLFESDEVVDSIIQVSSQTDEIINPTKQISPQSYEAIGSMIQTLQTLLSESNSTIALDSIIQTLFKSNEVLASIIHTPLSESNSTVAVDSMIQPPFKRDEELASIIHILPHESNSTVSVDSMIQTSIKPTIQPDEPLTSMIHILPPESNSIVETSLDASEFGFSLFECDSGEFDFTSLLQSPRIDEKGLFEMMATSDVCCHENHLC